jgi:PAS domain S-box-containing protein
MNAWDDRQGSARLMGYAAAAAAVLVAAVVQWLFDPWLGIKLPYDSFFVAIIAAAWIGGTGPAVFAALLGFVTVLYVFVPPRFSFAIESGHYLFGFVLYVVASTMIVAIVRAMNGARRAAQEQQQMWLTTLASIADAVVATDPVGRVTFINPAAEQLTGWTRAAAQGRPLYEVVHLVRAGTREPVPDPVATVARLGRATALGEQSLLVARDGRERPIDDSAAPIRDETGALSGVVLVFHDIAQRLQAEHERQLAQEHVIATLESIPEAFVRLGPDWRIGWVNQQYERRFGRLRASQFGKCFWDEWPELADGAAETMLRDAMDSRRMHEIEHLCPDRQRWFALKACPVDGGDLALFIQDVTDRHHAQEALLASQQRFRLAAEAVSGIIYDYDLPSGHVERTQGLFEVVGYRPEEVPPTAAWWWDQIHPDDRRELESRSVLPSRAALGREVHVYRARHKDGHYVWLSDRSLSVRDEHGQLARQVGCSIDITALKEAEQQLREADRRKDEFLATLAHELRNPLAPITNAAHFLKAIVAEPKAAWGLGVIERQVQNMARLLDDLLDVSRISRNKLVLRRQQVELAHVLQQAIETSRPLVDMGGHELAVHLPPDPVLLDADPLRLAQVFSNLLTNAAKYTPGGGHIELDAQCNGDEARIRVRDDGIGIAADMMPRLFEIFSQAAPALERSQGGLGIGLSLVRGLVELHGGHIEAHSEGAGRGSEFVVTMPVLARAPPVPLHRDGKAAALPARRARVLVADDNHDGADSLTVALQGLGHEVCTAYDGEQALALAASTRPEVMLVDIGMPRMNGYEVCRAVRREPWGREVLLVALTGWGQDEDRRRAAEAGFDRHLVKPVDLPVLSELLAGAQVNPQ